MIEVVLLGPVDACTGDGPSGLARPLERALLARLALEPGLVVDRGRLLDELWMAAPAGGLKALHTLVYRLRRSLQPEGQALAMTAGGYLLTVKAAGVDACRFEELAARGRHRCQAGDLAGAAESLGEALALWRGTALANVGDVPFATAQRSRLEELRRGVEEDLTDARLGLGQHQVVVAGLEASVAAEPLRERRWGQLMLALYRCGRQADALRAYARLRSLLGEELGIEPSTDLVALEQAILLQKPELIAPQAPAVTVPFLIAAPAAAWASADARDPEPVVVAAESPNLGAVSVGEPHVAIGGRPSPQPARTVSSVDSRRSEPAAAEPSHGRHDDAVIALPARLAVAPTAGFMGRAAEARVLASAVKAASAGEERQVVLVGGEAGVGKTTLVADAARAAHDQGVTVLYGRCDEDLAVPYGPFVEVVSHYLTQAPVEWLALHDSHRLGELERLVPGLTQRFGQLPAPTATDPDAERYLLFGALAGLLSDAAARAPVMVVLDDLHWADRPSLKLLCHLAARPLGRVVIVGTFRDAELSAIHPLTEALAALRREQAVERLTLSGLSPVEVAAYLDAAVGRELGQAGAELARVLYQETDGNPFFVAEVLRHLTETGLIGPGPDGSWMASAALGAPGLPDSVREVVGARVGRLGDPAVPVLSTAAVIGQEFDLDLLARATGIDEDKILDVLDQATRAALVSEMSQVAGRFRFAHALIGRSLYEELGATRQGRAHARVAAALEELCGDDSGQRTGELARHFLAAVSRPDQIPKAVAYARRAGERALCALAPDEAVRWYSQAVATLGGAPDELEQARCLVGLGDAQRQAGDPEFRTTLLEAARLARRLGDGELVVRAALANNRGFESSSGEVDAERVDILEAALDTPTEDTPQRARLLATLAVELTYHPDLERRVALADEAVAVARRSNDDAALFDALVRPYPALMVPELADHRLHRVLEGVELSEKIDDPVARFWMFAWLGLAMVEHADIERVSRAFTQVDRIAAEVDQPNLRWASTWASSWRALLAGDVGRAEGLATQALQIGNDSGQPDALIIYGLQLLCVRWHQGRLNEILPSLRQLATDDNRLPAWQAALAFGEALEGDPTHARELLRAARATGFELPDDRVRLIGTCAWAEAASELGDHSGAVQLYERLAPWHDHVPISGHAVFHCVAHSLGRLAATSGRPAQAEAHLTEALSIHRRLKAPFFIAETELALGRLLAGNQPDRSSALLTDAAELATRHGYTRLEHQARQALV